MMKHFKWVCYLHWCGFIDSNPFSSHLPKILLFFFFNFELNIIYAYFHYRRVGENFLSPSILLIFKVPLRFLVNFLCIHPDTCVYMCNFFFGHSFASTVFSFNNLGYFYTSRSTRRTLFLIV